MREHSTFQPKSRFTKWLEARLPIISLVHNSFASYTTPRNLNYRGVSGAILTFMLVAQIRTGLVLTTHWVPRHGQVWLQAGLAAPAYLVGSRGGATALCATGPSGAGSTPPAQS